jgi:hypothetical protein
MRLFQDSCAYVGRKCHLLEGLTTKQTLYYAAHLTIGTRIHASAVLLYSHLNNYTKGSATQIYLSSFDKEKSNQSKSKNRIESFHEL